MCEVSNRLVGEVLMGVIVSDGSQSSSRTRLASRKAGVVCSLVCALGAVLGASHASAVLVSSTLPASRSVQVSDTATLFATVINAGGNDASGCTISLATAIDADIFFQTTDPATNALSGERDQPVTIAAGAAQSFLVGVTPNSAFAPTDIEFNFACADTAPAANISGLNTLLLSASDTPVPDMVAIALTPSGDGIAQIPQEAGLGFLSMASVNVGAAANLVVNARIPSGLDGVLLICETRPSDGSCIDPPAASVDINVPSNGTPTFAVFLSSFLALSLDAANRRLFVEFRDETDAVRGSTSVAIAGGGPAIDAAFPTSDSGTFELPTGPAANQMSWFVDQLAAASTSLADINARFAPEFLQSVPAADLQSFIDGLRTGNFGNAEIIDLVTVTPAVITAVIRNDATDAVEGFVNLSTRLDGAGLITQLSVNNFGGNVQFFNDQSLTLEQAADDFMNTGADNSLVVARINSANQCIPIVARQADTPRTIASIFKVWVLGTLGQAIAQGSISPTLDIPLDPAQFALAGTINNNSAGTVVSLSDMATLMIGISDNTATDHIHNLLPQTMLDNIVDAYGHATPQLMQPLLSISQQFSLYFTFPLDIASSYVNGSEAFQAQFSVDEIEPIGSVLGGDFFHNSLLVDAAWMASPLDACNAYARLRNSAPVGTAQFEIIDRAMSASVAQPDVRNAWDRAWYKGGSLAGSNGGVNEQRVLTHAWFLESAERGRFFVGAFANNRFSGNIDAFEVQSLTSRMLELVSVLGAQ